MAGQHETYRTLDAFGFEKPVCLGIPEAVIGPVRQRSQRRRLGKRSEAGRVALSWQAVERLVAPSDFSLAGYTLDGGKQLDRAGACTGGRDKGGGV
jgi:hypothetical protein